MAEGCWEGNRSGIARADSGLVFYDGHKCQKGFGGVHLCDLILWPAVEVSGATIADFLSPSGNIVFWLALLSPT